MKWIFFTLLMVIHTMDVHAKVLHHALGDGYRLLFIETDMRVKRSAGLYSLDISYQGSNLGLVRDFNLGASWSSSFGVLMADEYIDISTVRSDIQIGNRLFNLSKYLGMHARIKFYDFTPFASLSYQYTNDSNNMVFDFITGLKLLKIDGSRMHFNNVLGKALEDLPEISSELKRQTMQPLDEYYLLPVIDFRFSYFFN